MHEQLTARSDYDTGLFLEVRASATLLLPAMNKYRNDIPNEGTAIEFNIEGTEEDFLISRMALTVEDGAGTKFTASGIGTNKIKISGMAGATVGFIPYESVKDKVDIGVRQEQLGLITETKGIITSSDLIAYRHFVIILPINITEKTNYLNVMGEDLVKPKYKVNFRWNFIR